MSPARFLGTHVATIDAEGRVQLPAALRDEVNVRQPEFLFVATLEGDGSLCLRERERWEAWSAALGAVPIRDQRDRATLLAIAAHSAPVKCDKQGRVRIPDALLRLVGIDRADADAREVVLAGGFDEIRVWSPAGWSAFSERARAGLSDGLDRLLGAAEGAPGDD